MKARRVTGSRLYIITSLILILVLASISTIFYKKWIAQPCFSLPTVRLPHLPIPTTRTSATPSGFVARSDSQLMLNGRPFRFAGANIHWLALDDSITYPSPFRVNDALDAVRGMGV